MKTWVYIQKKKIIEQFQKIRVINRIYIKKKRIE